MISRVKNLLAGVCAVMVAAALILPAHRAPAQSQPATATGSVVKPVGTVKAISGNTITLATDSGSMLSVTIQDSARMVRTQPGQKDLKGASPVQLHDLQVGDRMVVAHGNPSDDGKSIVATVVIIMAGADIAAKQQQERDDWRKRGIGGTVKEVDSANGTITVVAQGAAGSKPTLVHVSKDTIIRRYAPDSVKFDDANPGTLAQIQPGDQLRARGARNVETGELKADEIVSGKFRNVAGTVVSTDAANNSVTVQDLISKSQVTLKVGADSQLRNLPPMVAQRIALRWKGGPQQERANAASSNQNADARPAGMSAGGPGSGQRAGDFQQMLERMPAVTLPELQKGTVVMAVATEGSDTRPPTTITLLTGVEPILTASPDNKGAAMLLSPWNLGGADTPGASQ